MGSRRTRLQSRLDQTSGIHIGRPRVHASENTMKHKFGLTPATSIFVQSDNEAGQVLMPIGDYGFSKMFGWTGDKYGITWQLNLAD